MSATGRGRRDRDARAAARSCVGPGGTGDSRHGRRRPAPRDRHRDGRRRPRGPPRANARRYRRTRPAKAASSISLTASSAERRFRHRLAGSVAASGWFQLALAARRQASCARRRSCRCSLPSGIALPCTACAMICALVLHELGRRLQHDVLRRHLETIMRRLARHGRWCNAPRSASSDIGIGHRRAGLELQRLRRRHRR